MSEREQWAVRECATLGAHFADVYRGEELFAMQLPRSLAERFVADPQYWGNVHAPVPMQRAWALEAEYRWRTGAHVWPESTERLAAAHAELARLRAALEEIASGECTELVGDSMCDGCIARAALGGSA